MSNLSNEPQIQISQRYRWIENAHILLWLIKDTCWALEFKPGGIFMIIPTVGVAFYITYQGRNVRSELFHNIAVCLWILANSVWMLGEFFDHDTRIYAASLFITGLAVLGVYYALYFKKDRKRDKRYVLDVE